MAHNDGDVPREVPLQTNYTHNPYAAYPLNGTESYQGVTSNVSQTLAHSSISNLDEPPNNWNGRLRQALISCNVLSTPEMGSTINSGPSFEQHPHHLIPPNTTDGTAPMMAAVPPVLFCAVPVGTPLEFSFFAYCYPTQAAALRCSFENIAPSGVWRQLQTTDLPTSIHRVKAPLKRSNPRAPHHSSSTTVPHSVPPVAPLTPVSRKGALLLLQQHYWRTLAAQRRAMGAPSQPPQEGSSAPGRHEERQKKAEASPSH